MENKQTAVKWLVEQMFKQGYFDGNKPLSITNLDHLEEQAKKMEKEQIMEAFKHGKLPTFLGKSITSEQFYNETYGNSKTPPGAHCE